MKPKQEPTPTAETPWEPLSPEQITSGIEWLERTKAAGDLRPVSQEPKTRRVMKAYPEAPIETRHLAARKAAADCESRRRETEIESTRRKAEMESTRRYNSGVAAFCGLLGGVVLPILIGREWYLDDRWLAILCSVGLPGGWVLGAAYIYPVFYYKGGTPRPHTARIHAAIGSRGRRLCAKGRHNWNGFPSMCKRCGKPQFPGHYRAPESTRV